MADVQIESDPLFQLLTDALRAGPQSAEWSQAVAQVREGGSGAEADEYKLLLQARENLESGKEYKAVRAGTGFTRNLFGKIDEEKEAAKAKGLPTANLLAIGAGVVLLGVIAVVAVMIGRGRGGGGGPETLPALFPNSVVATTFAQGEKGLTITGTTPPDLSNGLRPGPAPKDAATQYLQTDASVDQPIPGRFEIEVDLQAPPGKPQTVSTAIIIPPPANRKVTDVGLAWVLSGDTQRVMAGDGPALKTAPIPADGKITVRIVVGKTVAAVYSNKELLWTGAHGLPEGPKTPVIRMLRPKGDDGPVPAITAVRVRTEPKPPSRE
jgi:hypothetical protein